MYDPIWLLSFVTVAETLNFSAAGSRLAIRQSTVSDHVRKLEAACGRRLFTRDSHSVKITPDGEAMVGFATTILETASRAQEHFAAEEIRGRIRFGVSEDIVLRGFPQALRKFISEHPHVELELTVGLSESLRDQLNTGDLDLVFIKRRVGESHGELAWREPLVWISAPDFQMDPERPLPLILLEPPALTRSAALAALEGLGMRWHIVCASGSQAGVHAALSAGMGVAPHARSLAPLASMEVTDGGLPPLGEIEFVFMGGRSAQRGPARALASTIQEYGLVLREPS